MKRQVEIDLETAREWYETGGTLREIALQAFNKNELTYSGLPKSWEEAVRKFKKLDYMRTGYFISSNSVISNISLNTDDTWRNTLPSRELSEAILALDQLLMIREVYWDTWKPDYYDNTIKYTVTPRLNDWLVAELITVPEIFVFRTEEQAKHFLTYHRDLLNKTLPLWGVSYSTL